MNCVLRRVDENETNLLECNRTNFSCGMAFSYDIWVASVLDVLPMEKTLARFERN